MTFQSSDALIQIEITGYGLTIEQLSQVANHGAKVILAPVAAEQMATGRQILDEAIARGERIYGATTSVGPRTSASLSPEHIAEFNKRLLRTHHVGHGPEASQNIVRATLCVLLNALASGRTGARLQLAQVLVEALNQNKPVAMHLWGSMGQSDMSAMADIGLALFQDFELAAGEALAILNSSALATGMSALSYSALHGILRFATNVAAVSMDGFAANPSIVSKTALESRHFSGAHIHGAALGAQLEGSYLFEKDGPRNHQDPLCFRALPLIHGAADDSLRFAGQQIAQELNSAQCNPVISLEHRTLAATANFDMVTLCMALDVMRQAFTPVLTSATERVAKMVDTTWSGLPIGLIEDDGIGAPGFNGVALFHKSITSEARLLSAPLAGELASSSHSNSVMDRASLAVLGARRALELHTLARSIISMELMVAAQAIDMRGQKPLGNGTRQLYEFTREVVPFSSGASGIPDVRRLMDHLDNAQGVALADWVTEQSGTAYAASGLHRMQGR